MHFFVYLIEASICISLLYAVYLIFIKRDTFHNLKRYYLLVSLFISLIIPQLPSIHISKVVDDTVLSNNLNSQDYAIYNDTFEKVVFGNMPEQENIRSIYNKQERNIFLLLLLTSYALGACLMSYRFIKNIYQIRKLVRGNATEISGNHQIVRHKTSLSAFSFFKYIFLNSEEIESQDIRTILKHEEIHIQLGHSFDVIFIECYKILFWFNPIIWWYKKSLLEVHEHQVDNYLIHDKAEDMDSYQEILLKQYLGNVNIELAHSFNHSQIKFRIKMMKKSKSKWWTNFKMIIAIPVIAVSLLAFTNTGIEFPSDNQSISTKRKKFHEPDAAGMCYIPGGSYQLNRTDGNTTKSFNVSVDAFWMKETEVRVEEYNKYLEAIKRDSSQQVYEAALPDKDKAPFEDYFVSEEYLGYPVVGISLLQAQNYCKWVTQVENLRLEKKGLPPVADVRIPTEVEWIYASFGGKDPDEVEKPEISELSAPTKRTPVNGWSLMNMFDNVSEWTYTCFDPETYMNQLQNYPGITLDNIIVIGNNFKNSMVKDKLILNGNDTYDYVGFRSVRTYLGDQYGKTDRKVNG